MSDLALSTAVPLIANFEGFRSAPYQDQGGVWTIGFGETLNADGTRVSASTAPITREDAEARLSGAVANVLAMVRDMVHVPMTDNQAAALTSFAYNLGTSALRNSTLMLRLNQGNIDEAADCFAAWIYVDDKPNDGLRNRRAAERTLFLTPDAAPQPTADQLDILYNPTETS